MRQPPPPLEPDPGSTRMSDLERYTHGHHASVVGQHLRRTAERDAAYLLPHLRPGQRVIDVGCGPGTITRDIATRVAPGEVLGVDAQLDVLELAREQSAGHTAAPHFQLADVYALPFEDGSFDVAHAHQVLQHLSHPIDALREIHRVLRPGALLGVRDADYATMIGWPKRPEIERWVELYRAVARRNGAEPDAGRCLPDWLRRAGFEQVEVRPDVVHMATSEETANWGHSWAERVLESNLGKQALEYELATPDELDWIACGFRAWAHSPGALFLYVNVACLARAAQDRHA